MTNETKDGGPAFPSETGLDFHCGMSKRDWFAGLALQGLLACQGEHMGIFGTDRITPSKMAYEYADAMLKAGSDD